MEKKNLSTYSPFLVRPELIRKREGRKTFCFNRKTTKTQGQQHSKYHLYTQFQSPENSVLSNGQHKQKDVNWLKYNIFVGIYKNWLRLYPYIQHLLHKYPGLNDSISQNMQAFGFLKRSQSQELQGKSNCQKQVIKSLIQTMRLRLQQLLNKAAENDENNIDGDIIKMANHMAQQLLSTLSIQNTKWNKLRMQKHNRLINQAINKFNQSQFAVNSQAILSSLKERLQIIQKVQQSYMDSTKLEAKNKLKLISLKQPFQKGLFAASKSSNIQQKLQLAWNQLKNQRLNTSSKNKEQKKIAKSNQRYIILSRPNNESLVVKYKNKRNDYINQSYIKNKLSLKRIKKKNSNYKEKNEDYDQKKAQRQQFQRSVVHIEEVSNSSRKSSMPDNCGKELQKQELEKLESFLRKARQKQGLKDNQGSFFIKNRVKKKLSVPRPSISFLQSPKLLKQNENRKSFSLQVLKVEKNDRASIRSRQIMPSIQNIFEQKQDYLNLYKSHMKTGTVKTLKGFDSKLTITKQQKTLHKISEYNLKIQNSQSKLDQSQKKKEPFYNRRGKLLRKGVFRKPFECLANLGDISALQTSDFIDKKHEIIAYLIAVKQRGLLNEQKYLHLKQKVDQLILKSSASSKAANKAYAQKIYEKSMQQERHELPESLTTSHSFQRREHFLKKLSSTISNDERIKMKIREQLKIYQAESVDAGKSQSQTGSEQYVFKSVELTNLQAQLKRILQFQQQNCSISFSNYFKKTYNKLQQKEFQ